mmetsp:Transcript_85793/g.242949  ORF Transcript_85793/g.242949 Transcript_85793/m.242949 type:complete len:344 (-) Transcript_85793:488-1519(-)
MFTSAYRFLPPPTLLRYAFRSFMPFSEFAIAFLSLIGLPATLNNLSFFSSTRPVGMTVILFSLSSMCSKLDTSPTASGSTEISLPTAERVTSCFCCPQEIPSNDVSLFASTFRADSRVKGVSCSIEVSWLKEISNISRDPAMLSHVSTSSNEDILLCDRLIDRMRCSSRRPCGMAERALPCRDSSSRLSAMVLGKKSWNASCSSTPGGSLSSTLVRKKHLSSVESNVLYSGSLGRSTAIAFLMRLLSTPHSPLSNTSFTSGQLAEAGCGHACSPAAGLVPPSAAAFLWRPVLRALLTGAAFCFSSTGPGSASSSSSSSSSGGWACLSPSEPQEGHVVGSSSRS